MALMIMHYVDHMKSPTKDAAFICHLRGQCHAMYLHQSHLDSTWNKTKPLGHVQCKTKRVIVTIGRNGWGIDSKRFDNCKFTRIDTTGNSVVDYLICHPESLRLVSYFNVHQRFPESDHLPVVFSLRHRENGTRDDGPVHQSNNWENTFKYVWSVNDVPKINEMLNDNASDFRRKKFEDNMINMTSANDVVKEYNNLITQACERVCDISQIKLQKKI